MYNILRIGVITLALTLPATGSFADGKNWSDDKANQVDANRNSDAGIGNGGERQRRGNWRPTLWGEDGPADVDPGNSGDHNNACGDDGVHPKNTAC